MVRCDRFAIGEIDQTDLCDEHPGQDRPDPGNGLDRDMTGVGAQPAGDAPREGAISKSGAVITRRSESVLDPDSAGRENICTPSGCARCTMAPSSARVSAAQYQP
jgi:hypothetical protein